MHLYDVILIFAESFMLLYPLLDYLWRYLLWTLCVNEQSTVLPEVLSIGEVTKH